ncbi:MAG: hypothetical protein R3305_06295 [Gammaproteobacteria bacterium]|nr:hypothetical protein [Gammaproteobacteria bacterium]
MTAVLVVCVFAGFAPTFFLRPFFDAAPLPSVLVIVHGVVYSVWMLLFAVQVSLAETGSIRLHRRIGLGGGALAALMLVLGIATGAEIAQRMTALDELPPGIPPAGFIFWLSVITAIVFAAMIATAIRFRHQPQVHKRLMLIATFLISVAAFDRLFRYSVFGPLMLTLGWAPWYLLMFAVADLFLVALAAHDWVKQGRIHAATAWASLVVIGAQALPVLLGLSATFDSLMHWLVL